VPDSALVPTVTGCVDMCFPGRAVRRPSARFEVVPKRFADDFGDGDALIFGALCESCFQVRIQTHGLNG
jgi:hypothetical protein